MLKIFTTQQIREADQYTISHEPIASIDLMERASKAFVQQFTELFSTRYPIVIFCGMGNNGGDGLAIARLLSEERYKVKAYIVKHSENSSPDFQQNLKRLEASQNNPTWIKAYEELPALEEGALVIDALLGSGLQRQLEGLLLKVVQYINHANVLRVAVDVPTGLSTEHLSLTPEKVIQAHHTITFQTPKLAFLLPENEALVGNWHVVNIQLSPDFIEKTPTDNFLLERNDILARLQPRSKFSHKGSFGHALLMVGSKGKIGAALLASKALLRTGAGLLTTHLPNCGNWILQTAFPEAMLHLDPAEDCLSEIIPQIEKYQAIGVGCGIGREEKTQQMLRSLLEVLQKNSIPLVLDADALNIIGEEHREWQDLLPPNTILTPHPKEFERLAGKSQHSLERLSLLRSWAVQKKVYVVLKGHHTAIATPEGRVYFNSTGNAGMATAGSGDTLTGIITSLLSQGYTPEASCMIGVYLHGLAGDIAARQHSMSALLASDIIEHIGDAFKVLYAQ
ncbi:MAG: NAD(P)H-hydrate dehydratase [Cytophagales bacterium]|nr:MAG: NAD(P)H-hydrate dehydratase [Cytophagales bacterium]